ncbi:MAG: RDD family protein [Acidimicrobiales bacterium]|nr:RDD family protein [Acidimicrobiales bacterium]
MITPSQTDVLPRRIAASAVDLGSVLLIWGIVLYRLAVRFQISNRSPEGRPIYSEFQRRQLEAIDEGLNFGTTIGDYYYSLHGRGLVLSALSLLIFSLIAWVLIPANTGWSLGHRALNLRVTDLHGQKPPLDSYLRRYLVGVVDLFPFVVPGLLGWVIASRNERRQRIGDLTADTVVVDAADAVIFEGPEVTTTVIRGADKDSAAKGVVVASNRGITDAPAPPESDDLISVDLDRALTGIGSADFPVLDLEETASVPIVGSDALTPDPVPSPATSSGLSESTTDHEIEVITDRDDPLPQSTYASEWHFPESADAPVWTPDSTTNRGPSPAATESPSEKREADASTSTAAASALSAGLGKPVWNEEWSAWLYWDANGKRWLRHDEAKGWVPIEDTQSV